ncbi:MAG: DUF1802 family protein [candidate division NC10 bacterium]|nr:DUF1802 family protein [candidate division NC10 bacterium]
MKEQNRIALKEWAVVVKAMKEGKQILLLRKGGIAEEGAEFRVEHPEFFFYPTYTHQAKDHVRPPFLEDLEAAKETPEVWGKVRIDSYVVVEEVIEAEDLGRLRKLQEHHIWTPAYVEMRFHYRPENPLYVMLLRIYNLPEVFVLEETKEYRGCKSWVTLDQELPTIGAAPILSNDEFAMRAEAIRATLKGT